MSEKTNTCEELLIEADGIGLSASLHLPGKVPAPVIVCSHGLVSSKESPKFVAIGEEMSKAGFCVLRFDFSACGGSPRRPSTSVVESRRHDLGTVISFVSKQKWSQGRIGLLGSSLGGFLSLWTANEHPKLIQAVVSWAAPFDMGAIQPDKLDLKELQALYPEGFTLGTPTDLDALNGVERVLVIHGQMDEVVPWKDSVRIYERLQNPKRLLLMRTADHKVSDESWRKKAVQTSLEWFLTYLE